MSQASNIVELSGKYRATFRKPDQVGRAKRSARPGERAPKRTGERGGPCDAVAARPVVSSSSPPAWVIESSPPVGNTGGNLTLRSTVKLDWIAGTVPATYLDRLRSFVSDLLGPAEDMDHGQHTYQSGCVWATGAKLFWTDGRAECCLSLNGRSVDQIPLGQLRGVCCQLVESFTFKASRVDLAFDDYARRVSVQQVRQAAEAHDFTGFQVWQSHQAHRARDLVGDSVRFGRRGKDGSGKSLIVYDKGLESAGEIDAVRWEVTLSKETAALWFQCLADSSSDEFFTKKITSIIGGCIDFVSRGNHQHRDRMPRLSWWADLVQVLDASVLVIHQHTPPLQQTYEKWIRPSVLPSLVKIRAVVQSQGYDFSKLLDDELDRAESKVHWRGDQDLGINISETFG